MPQPMLTTAQVAEHFSVQQSDVAYWCRAGLLKTMPRNGSRRWLIHPSEIQRLEREGTPPSRRTLEAQ